MSETLITWPDVCVFCGDSNGKVGRTANEHWKQFRCGTEYEVIEGKTAWIQDDECKIAELRTALAAATKRAEAAEQENARLMEGIESMCRVMETLTYADISRHWAMNRLAALLAKPEEKQ